MEADDNDIDIVRAPWTPEQVEALNAWQQLGYMHEFTCPNSHETSRVLVAAPDGWHCLTCGYTQDWAHDFMADKAKHPPNPSDALFGRANLDRTS